MYHVIFGSGAADERTLLHCLSTASVRQKETDIAIAGPTAFGPANGFISSSVDASAIVCTRHQFSAFIKPIFCAFE